MITLGIKYISLMSLEEATALNNTYTLNHIEFIQKMCDLAVLNFSTTIILNASQRNFGLKIKVSLIYNFFVVVLTLVRLACIAFIVVILYPKVFELFKIAWNMNKTNTWKSPDEPYFTSCSTFNMVVSFIYQYMLVFMAYLLMFCAVVYGIMFIIYLRGKNSTINMVIGIIIKILRSMFLNCIVGTMSFVVDALGRQVGNE